jgi:hypothetical protein
MPPYVEPKVSRNTSEFHPELVSAELALWTAVKSGTITVAELSNLVANATIQDSRSQQAAKRVLKRLAHATADKLELALAEPRLQPLEWFPTRQYGTPHPPRTGGTPP